MSCPTDSITIPARINDTLTVRRGSTVLHETEDYGSWDGEGEPPLVKVRAVLGLLRYGGALASVSYEMSGVPLQEDEVPVDELALDLEDETGRFHAIRWLEKNSPEGAALVAMWRQVRRRGQLPDYLSALDLDLDATLEDGSSRAAALVLQAVCLAVPR